MQLTSDGVHLKQNHILSHQDLINALKMKIKPGFFNIFFKKFTLQALVDYFTEIKNNPIEDSITKRSSNFMKISPD